MQSNLYAQTAYHNGVQPANAAETSTTTTASTTTSVVGEAGSTASESVVQAQAPPTFDDNDVVPFSAPSAPVVPPSPSNPSHMLSLLTQLGLKSFYVSLRELGVKSVRQLSVVLDDDLLAAGLSPKQLQDLRDVVPASSLANSESAPSSDDEDDAVSALADNIARVSIATVAVPEIGDSVMAYWPRTNKYYRGRVSAVKRSNNSTVNIDFDDGDKRQDVPVSQVCAYLVGAKVQALWPATNKYYSGVVAAVNFDGSCNIHFNDGDKRSNVVQNQIRPDVTYAVDQAVRAYWPATQSYFSGKIAAVHDNGLVDVAFNDGDFRGSIPLSQIRGPTQSKVNNACSNNNNAPAVPEVDDVVMAYWPGTKKYYRGKVSAVQRSDSTVNIHFDDGDKRQNVPVSEVCIHLIGARVKAFWPGTRKYYSGIVATVNPDGSCNIDFNDGDKRSNVPQTEIRPDVTYSVGDAVRAYWPSTRSYFSGKIVAVSDGFVNVDFNDGDKRSQIPLCEIRTSKTNAVSANSISSYSVGARVQAFWPSTSKWYPGTVSAVSSGTVSVDFDDGDKRSNVPLNEVLLIENSTENPVGCRVSALWPPTRRYYTGRVSGVSGNNVSIAFDDGDRRDNVPPSEVCKIPTSNLSGTQIKTGDRVEIWWKGMKMWYAGTVVQVRRGGPQDANHYIKYDDNDEKWESLSGRRWRVPGTHNLDKKFGQPCQAEWTDGRWYSGRVTSQRTSGLVHVDFNDGDERDVNFDTQVRPQGTYKSAVGHLVSAQWVDKKWYFGHIHAEKGSGRFDIHFEDGDRREDVHWSEIRLVGIEAQK